MYILTVDVERRHFLQRKWRWH